MRIFPVLKSKTSNNISRAIISNAATISEPLRGNPRKVHNRGAMKNNTRDNILALGLMVKAARQHNARTVNKLMKIFATLAAS
jgi:hypothetical protein